MVGSIASSLALSLLAAGPASDGSSGKLFGHDTLEVPPLTDEELAERRAAFEQMLEDNDWVQIGDQVRPAAPDGSFAQPPASPQHAWSYPPHRATIFLNFFGAVLTPGTNAALNESSCVPSELDWPRFDGTEQQALDLIQVFENQMEPYGVRIAYDEVPPSHLPYAMVMMGGTSAMLGLGGSVLGVSCSSDCGDRWWRDTTFAFTANSSSNNASLLGTTALHEAAHAFGLGHIGDSSRVMNPFVGSANVTWATACTPYDAATGGINCQPTHDEFCDGGAQNSHAELLAYFGENSPDVTPPEVTILSPEDGLELEVGGSVTIEADITDDHDGAGWRLVIPEADQEAVAFTFEKQWQLDNLPEGTYTLRVEAIDHERNEGSDEVTIYVGVEPGETTDTGESDSDSDSDSGTSGGSDSDGSDSDSDGSGSSDTDTVGETDPDKDGCGCRTTGDGPRAPWMLGLLALLGLRRRAGDVVS